MSVKITGLGLFTPPHIISNQELVDSFNKYVDNYNNKHNPKEPLQYSSSSFIEKASGIKNRKTLDKEGILNPERMRPNLEANQKNKPSTLAQMGLTAAHEALEQAKLKPQDIDLIIVACSNLPRAYPSLAIELQHFLGASCVAFDTNVACSSAVFGIATANQWLQHENINKAIIISPEICTAHLNFRDRDCHFIFGDAATAVVLEKNANHGLKIVNSHLQTQYSENIINEFGFLNPCQPPLEPYQYLFKQEGRKVFKNVVPMVSKHLSSQLESLQMTASDIKKYWLHQANRHINELVYQKLTGKSYDTNIAPILLDQWANTSSCGSIIGLYHHSKLAEGDFGLLCAFGAGYSVGSLLLQGT